ncbi:galactose mutarotase isoform X2 [Daphnia magna]|uniref:galactose mutarotase isoform X2 n=1 Tax=Daphnia magna TaxID=35525 RepID=UPI001E1BA0EE|nr:galactose mutarotase isoform X2 [Daphnia magna]
MSFSSTHVTQEAFGEIRTSDGIQPVTQFTLTNPLGVKVQFITYGASVTNVFVPNKKGELHDVVLGFDDMAGYLKHENPYFGSTVGRVANRIAKGHFNLNGIEFQLAKNNGDNHLHGGTVGFDKVVWQAYAHRDGRITFTHSSPHLEEGYPGHLFTQVTYTLTDSNELIIDYRALTDRPTPVNLTNHSYFNLAGHNAGSQQLLNHHIQLCANQYTPVDSGQIPTGRVANVDGTVFDLRSETLLKDVIAKIPGGGYDHNFVINDSKNKFDNKLPLVAKIWHSESGRIMELFSDQPGCQIYTGNGFPADGSLVGKGGTVYSTHAGLAIEAQNFPDAINQPHFPGSVLQPGEVYHRTIVYKFGTQ